MHQRYAMRPNVKLRSDMNNQSSDDPIDEIEVSEEYVRSRGWMAAAGMSDRRYPLTTSEAAAVLREGGHYDIDAEGLSRLVDRGMVDAPGRGEESELEWSAVDLCAASATLEVRRQYLPSAAHALKLSPEEMQLRDAMGRGVEDVRRILFPDGAPRFDLRVVLEAVRSMNDSRTRNVFVCFLEGLLFTEHGTTAR